MKVFKRYENCSFDNFEGNDVLVETLKDYKNLNSNVVITGSVGLGKTHLAYAILNAECTKKEIGEDEFMYLSKFVEYIKIDDVFKRARACWKDNANELDISARLRLRKIPLLIIDEVGLQYGTDTEHKEFCELLDYRYANELPTIILSNLNKEQLTKVLGLRVIDRLYGGAKVFELKGESYRKRT